METTTERGARTGAPAGPPGGRGGDPGGGGWRNNDRERHRLQVLSTLYQRPGSNPRRVARQTRLPAERLAEIVEDLEAEGLVRAGGPPVGARRVLRTLDDAFADLVLWRFDPDPADVAPERPHFHLTEDGRSYPPLQRYFEEIGELHKYAKDSLHFQPWYLFDPKRWEFDRNGPPYLTFQLGRNPRRHDD